MILFHETTGRLMDQIEHPEIVIVACGNLVYGKNRISNQWGKDEFLNKAYWNNRMAIQKIIK